MSKIQAGNLARLYVIPIGLAVVCLSLLPNKSCGGDIACFIVTAELDELDSPDNHGDVLDAANERSCTPDECIAVASSDNSRLLSDSDINVVKSRAPPVREPSIST